MTTTRLTMAQALVKFLDNQYIEVDGVQSKFVAGIFTIFGHGNVLGLGQALEQDSGDLIVHQGRNEQGMELPPFFTDDETLATDLFAAGKRAHGIKSQ